MTDTLTIDQLVATVPELDGLTDRVDRIIHRVAAGRLEQLLGSFPAAAQGEWCAPGVAVEVVLDLERPDSALEEAVARAVLEAIAEALRGSAALHYRGTVDALAAFVVAAATRRFADAWMWRQLGLIADAGDLEREPGACILGALECRPEHIVGAVVRAIGMAGFAEVHRLLGVQGWIALAGNVIEAAAGTATRGGLRAVLADDQNGSDDYIAKSAAGPQRSAHILAASRVVGGSHLAAAARASRIRLAGLTSRALAILVIAESVPTLLRRTGASPVCRDVAEILTGVVVPIAEIDGCATDKTPAGRQHQAAAAPGPTVVTPRGYEPPVAEGDVSDTLDTGSAGGEPTLGDETSWAGVLFLLNVADDATMPDTLLTDPALDGVAAPELLARVAMALVPVGAEDPVVFAFAGVDPHRRRPTWRGPLDEALAARVDEHAATWAAALVRRLGRDDDPLSCLAEIARRTGRIEREQGWMDVHLDLDSVDVDVRRGGLDIDPGWVPWLGSVVRFRYA